MPGDVDYDISSIRIDPQALGDDGHRLMALADQVGDSIKRINDTVGGLKLGWVSTSAEEAQAFGDHWNRVMKQMFGDKDGPVGVLPAMAAGVLGTGVGFSHLELELESSFLKFSDGLADTSGSSQPTNHTAPEFPITQEYPS